MGCDHNDWRDVLTMVMRNLTHRGGVGPPQSGAIWITTRRGMRWSMENAEATTTGQGPGKERPMVSILYWIAAVVAGFAILGWILRAPQRRLIGELRRQRAEREASGAPRCEYCGHAIVEEDNHAWNCPMCPDNTEDSVQEEGDA